MPSLLSQPPEDTDKTLLPDTHTYTQIRLSDKSKDINSIHLLKTYCLPGAALRTLICSQVLRDKPARLDLRPVLEA